MSDRLNRMIERLLAGIGFFKCQHGGWHHESRPGYCYAHKGNHPV